MLLPRLHRTQIKPERSSERGLRQAKPTTQRHNVYTLGNGYFIAWQADLAAQVRSHLARRASDAFPKRGPFCRSNSVRLACQHRLNSVMTTTDLCNNVV